MKKVLIIGANSASGKVLYKYLKNNDYDLYFCDLVTSYNKNISDRWNKIDFSYENIFKVIKEILPDQIYNFAGSFSNDYEIDYKANVILPKNILDSLLKLNINSKVLLIGSSSEYGLIRENDNPVNENCTLNPVSIYGLTKTFQSKLMNYYYNYKNVNVVMARTFNLIGNNLSDKLFIGKLYKQIEEYKAGRISKIELGNLQNKRDYISIFEAIKNYILIMNKGIPGEIYNVGSGKSLRISDLLKKILSDNGLSMDIVRENNIISRFDIKDIYADTSKINKLITG